MTAWAMTAVLSFGTGLGASSQDAETAATGLTTSGQQAGGSRANGQADVGSEARAGTHINEKGELAFPADYREWICLSSGLGMTYGPARPGPMEDPRFDNVFVNPEAYREFKKTGVWPEGTVFILEIRYSTSKGSINKGGYYQTDIAAIEANVKDKRFPGGWGFFIFGGGLRPVAAKAAELGQQAAGCRACHGTNGAVESTFTQFYPEALEIAMKKGTVKASFHPPTPSPSALARTLREQGWDATERALAAAKAMDPEAGVLREQTLNLLGYAMLQTGEQEKAVAMLRWVTERFPGSANAQDSLAEAYEAMGRKQESVAATRKALALLESDKSMDDGRRERVKKALAERLAKYGEK